ncbi:MAG TPA: LD-carboxypeptidase [Verrucomicrobiota bacterium]|nr:LD-carboxypeptidase [Verrucomicrobiota bacterium]HNT14251.1 LD-carboxypeptidase [Verrucomicrobiota bacterium]
MKLLYPPRLHPGDTLGVVAPASAPPDPKNVDRAIAVLERLGYRTKLAPKVHQRLGFLAGSDRDRAGDLMRMFTDRKVQAIICVRGGYGTARLLSRLDYPLIRANPKIFIGYSDITSLHGAFLTRAGLVSFHGPMLNSDFALKRLPAFTVQSFLRTLTSPAPPGDIATGYAGRTVKILRRGIARGRLIGGNITILNTLIGTRWLPDFKNTILFLEDVGEVPYRWDRMLTQLLNCGLLPQVAGVAIGLNARCQDPRAQTAGEYRQTLEEVFCERLRPLNIPVVAGLPFGHVAMNATLPVGARATLDANRGELRLDEAGVR